jgi:Uma2 family endonuclease
MATTTQIPLEVYLRSDYQPDAEYIDGEVRERPVGQDDHSAWQGAICEWFSQKAVSREIRVRPSLRVQVNPETFLVPDVAILDASLPKEPWATHPPLAGFEVLSPEDTVKKLKRKLTEYAAMGIPQIWVVDPDNGSFERFEAGCLSPATRFEQGSIQFNCSEIATLLQA